TPSATNIPDNEDVNNDNTISTQENYYRYEVAIEKGNLKVGEGYIVDKVNDGGENDAKEPVDWYLFRIPIRQPDTAINITNFKTIRFIRTYLTEFEKPIVLRLAKFQFVGSQWRRYEQSLENSNQTKPNDNNFTVSVVNIEENGSVTGNDIPYTLPPGV